MRILIFTFSLLVSVILNAQNHILVEIEEANAQYKTIEGMFTRTQINAAKGISVKSEGDLYIADDAQMAQYYKAPSTDLLIINGHDFYMVRGKKKNKFNTEKNKTMRGLRNTLLYCIHGKPAMLAAENSAEIIAEKKKGGYEVVLTSTKKTPRGYAKIVLTYDLESKLLTKMQMDEYNGNSTLYEMSDMKINTSIDAKVFDGSTKESLLKDE
jgi:outer membrane lipoprotein-sorting protein